MVWAFHSNFSTSAAILCMQEATAGATATIIHGSRMLCFCSVKFILHQLVDGFDQFWCTFTLKCVTVCLVSLQFLDVMHAVTIRRTIRRYRRKTCPIGSVLHFGEFWQLRVSFVSLLVRSAAVLRGRDCTTSSYRIHARRRLLSETEPDRELRGRLARLKVACAQIYTKVESSSLQIS